MLSFKNNPGVNKLQDCQQPQCSDYRFGFYTPQYLPTYMKYDLKKHHRAATIRLQEWAAATNSEVATRQAGTNSI